MILFFILKTEISHVSGAFNLGVGLLFRLTGFQRAAGGVLHHPQKPRSRASRPPLDSILIVLTEPPPDCPVF